MKFFAASLLILTRKSVGHVLQKYVGTCLTYKGIPVAWHQNRVVLAVRSEFLVFKPTLTHHTSQTCSEMFRMRIFTDLCCHVEYITVSDSAKSLWRTVVSVPARVLVLRHNLTSSNNINQAQSENKLMPFNSEHTACPTDIQNSRQRGGECRQCLYCRYLFGFVTPQHAIWILHLLRHFLYFDWSAPSGYWCKQRCVSEFKILNCPTNSIIVHSLLFSE